MSHDGVGPRAVMRSVVFLTAGVLAVPALTGCSEQDPAGKPTAGQEIAPADRGRIADGGTLRWAVDAVPATLNTFQADADAATSRIAGAALPSMYRLDANGRAQRNPDYLESAKVVDREPRQVVLYKLNQQAVWSDGREIGAADFAAQWRALSGRDSAYWTARNAGYDRIEKIERGADDLEVRVTFSKPYADWQSLFSPLYPKEVMGTPDAFNDGARKGLKVTAGPFALDSVDKKAGEVTLKRNPRWWGRPAKLSELVLRAVPRDKRTAALADGRLDLAEIDSPEARRIALAARDKGKGGAPLAHGPGAALTPGRALLSWAIAHGSDEEAAEEEVLARRKRGKAIRKYADEQASLRGFEVRKSLEPAFTQLALNGQGGPLADERVRRAVARALDRDELARIVLRPLGLPAEPVGSHLALAGQHAYADNSGALGGQDTKEAQALLADAGWVAGGTVKDEEKKEKKAAGAEASKDPDGSDDSDGSSASADPDDSDGSESADRSTGSDSSTGSDASDDSADSDGSASPDGSDGSEDDGTYIVGEDQKPGDAYGAAGDDKPGDNRGLSMLAPPLAQLQRAALLDQAHRLDVRAEVKRKPKEKRQLRPEKRQRKPYRTGDGPGTSAKAEQKHLAQDGKQQLKHGGAPGAYAPKGTAAPAPGRAAAGPLAKNGKPLSLRFVLPSGPGSQSLRAVGERIALMLERVGIRTEISKVSDASYFKDHIASGQYDLALYSWPASAFPATDGRPIYSKPVPAADGSLNVEQNYTRVGTDQVDQLFDQAIAELDPGESRSLVRKADARIWAAAGSIPLYQRPQLTAARTNLANAGAFGFQTPVYEDMGFLRKGEKPQVSPSSS